MYVKQPGVLEKTKAKVIHHGYGVGCQLDVRVSKMWCVGFILHSVQQMEVVRKIIEQRAYEAMAAGQGDVRDCAIL